MRSLILSAILLSAFSAAAQAPLPAVGQAYAPPVLSGGGPAIFAHSDDVLPDQSFVVTGSGLKAAETMLWGPSATSAGGQKWPVKIQSQSDSMIVATVPEQAPAGLYSLWVGNGGKWSAPVRLNAPELWWSTPDKAFAGDTIRVCGRNLARKPDNLIAPVYLRQPGKDGQWITPSKTDKYYLDLPLPKTLAAGRYELWVHAGSGGAQGWGVPL